MLRSVLSSYLKIKLESSLEVAPTTLSKTTIIFFVITCIHSRKEHFSSSDCELWPVTLTFELDLDIEQDQPACRISKWRSFGSKAVRTLRNTHTYRSDCSTWAIIVIRKYSVKRLKLRQFSCFKNNCFMLIFNYIQPGYTLVIGRI